jgi:hypothetical protein
MRIKRGLKLQSLLRMHFCKGIEVEPPTPRFNPHGSLIENDARGLNTIVHP